MARLRRPLMLSHFGRWDIPLTWALSIGLLFLGLTRPVIQTQVLIFFRNEHSILESIQAMWEKRRWLLAGLLGVFAIGLPALKLAALALLWVLPMTMRCRKAALVQIRVLSKWSMLDVFVVAVAVVTMQAGILLDVHPRQGLYCFAGSVLLSMIVTLMVERAARRG
jgi:paraquat-inducible protein A